MKLNRMQLKKIILKEINQISESKEQPIILAELEAKVEELIRIVFDNHEERLLALEAKLLEV